MCFAAAVVKVNAVYGGLEAFYADVPHEAVQKSGWRASAVAAIGFSEMREERGSFVGRNTVMFRW